MSPRFFFFQAEDGIRDFHVTGVQTCALPICGWLERVREAIASGLTAEAAVQRAFDDVRGRLGQSTDPYIRERLSDLQDLTNRMLLRLSGRVAADPASLPDEMIVIDRDMGPAELLDYDRTRLRGVV